MKKLFIVSLFVLLVAGQAIASECNIPKTIKKNKWVDVTLNNGTILHGKIRKISKSSCSFVIRVNKEKIEVSADQVTLVKKAKK